jgi:hypothetical protein
MVEVSPDGGDELARLRRLKNRMDTRRRRTNQYPAPVLDLQAVRAPTLVFPPAQDP